jgi:hypothetical protein
MLHRDLSWSIKMATAAQVKQAVQPLLRRNPDLALVGRFVVVKPVRHVLRGIHVDGTGVWYLTPKWTVNVLCSPLAGHLDRVWGAMVTPAYGGDLSRHEIMCEKIERLALPLLRQVQTLDDFVAFNVEERFPGRDLDAFPYVKVFVDIARGDFASALKFCEAVKTKNKYESFIPGSYEVFAETLYPMLAANDRAGLVQHLKDYELWAVKSRKLQKFWEPTPFPLESQTVKR